MRCRQEIAAIEGEIRAGNPDLEGLCLALADWSGELRLLQRGGGLATVAPPLAHVRSGGDSSELWTKAAVIGRERKQSGPDAESPPRECRAGQ